MASNQEQPGSFHVAEEHPARNSLLGIPTNYGRVEALVATKGQADHTAAVRLVHDLHEVSARRRQLDTFTRQMQQLRARHAKKVSLLDRLDRAQLA